MSLTAPVDFDSSDGHPVDLIFGLMVPEELDENDIAEIETLTGLLRNEALLARLRAATSSKELGEALLVDQTEPAATFLSARQG